VVEGKGSGEKECGSVFSFLLFLERNREEGLVSGRWRNPSWKRKEFLPCNNRSGKRREDLSSEKRFFFPLCRRKGR